MINLVVSPNNDAEVLVKYEVTLLYQVGHENVEFL